MQVKDIYLKVKQHLLTQNEKAQRFTEFSDLVGCAYKAKDGKMCAVGCLIKDYNPNMEGRVVEYLIAEFPNALGYLDLTHEKIDLLQELQVIHDGVSPQYWKKELEAYEQRTNILNS